MKTLANRGQVQGKNDFEKIQSLQKALANSKVIKSVDQAAVKLGSRLKYKTIQVLFYTTAGLIGAAFCASVVWSILKEKAHQKEVSTHTLPLPVSN